MKNFENLLRAFMTLQTIFALTLVVDLIRIRASSSGTASPFALDAFPPIWLSNSVFALALAFVGTGLALGLRSVWRLAPGPARRFVFPRGSIAVSIGLGIAALAICTLQHRGLRGSLAVSAITMIGAFAVSAFVTARFHFAAWIASNAVLGIVLIAVAGPSFGKRTNAQPDESLRASSQLPDVFLIVVDTLRSRNVGAYGHPNGTTPFFDRIARQSLLFEAAYSGSASTSPSTAAILGSPFPFTDDFVENGRAATRTRLPSLMRAAGYETAAFSANPWISRAMGFDSGFDHFRTLAPLESRFAVTRLLAGWAELLGPARSEFLGGSALNDEAFAWLATRSGRGPLFGYMHYMGPHYPFTPRTQYLKRIAGRVVRHGARLPAGTSRGEMGFEPGDPIDAEFQMSMIARYDAEILQWDRGFQRFCHELERSGRFENSLLIVTSDHGESFHDHDVWGHGNSLYDEITHVPLFVRVPGSGHGSVVRGPVSNTRISALIEHRLESGENRVADGVYQRILRHEGGVVISQNYKLAGDARAATVRDDRFKAIAATSGGVEWASVYDVVGDPAEDAALESDAAQPLLDLARMHLPNATTQSERIEIDATRKRLLESLGYVD